MESGFSFLLGFSIGVLVYVFVVEPLWVLPVLEWLTPRILYRVKAQKALVALSFDDGPHEEFTPQVLEILERYEAKATFFLIGERAERHPELVERIRAAGHEVGNHYSKNGTTLGHSRKRFVEELERTEGAIGILTSKSGPLQKAGPTTNQKQDLDLQNEPGARRRAPVELDEPALADREGASSRLRLSSGQAELQKGRLRSRPLQQPGVLSSFFGRREEWLGRGN